MLGQETWLNGVPLHFLTQRASKNKNIFQTLQWFWGKSGTFQAVVVWSFNQHFVFRGYYKNHLTLRVKGVWRMGIAVALAVFTVWYSSFLIVPDGFPGPAGRQTQGWKLDSVLQLLWETMNQWFNTAVPWVPVFVIGIVFLLREWGQ